MSGPFTDKLDLVIPSTSYTESSEHLQGLAFPLLNPSRYGSSLPTSLSSLPLSPNSAMTSTNGPKDLPRGLCTAVCCVQHFPRVPYLPISQGSHQSPLRKPLWPRSAIPSFTVLLSSLSLPHPFCLMIACGQNWNLGKSLHRGCSVLCRVNH